MRSNCIKCSKETTNEYSLYQLQINNCTFTQGQITQINLTKEGIMFTDHSSWKASRLFAHLAYQAKKKSFYACNGCIKRKKTVSIIRNIIFILVSLLTVPYTLSLWNLTERESWARFGVAVAILISAAFGIIGIVTLINNNTESYAYGIILDTLLYKPDILSNSGFIQVCREKTYNELKKRNFVVILSLLRGTGDNTLIPLDKIEDCKVAFSNYYLSKNHGSLELTELPSKFDLDILQV